MDLDRQQAFALLAEMTSTRNLLAYGIRVIRTGAFIDTTRDPIQTMLSIGVEKLYTLTLGLIALARDQRWPTKSEMQKQGHKLVPMHAVVERTAITHREQRSVCPRTPRRGGQRSGRPAHHRSARHVRTHGTVLLPG